MLALVREVKDELGRHHATAARRVSVRAHAQPMLIADPVLVKMLLRNLLGNAVQHTAGSVTVEIDQDQVDIIDEGAGLPQAYRDYLNNPQADAGELLSLSGLGLFIVSLACDRLGWRVHAVPAQAAGTCLRIVLTPPA